MLVKCRCLGGREGSSPSGVMVVTAHLEPSRYPPRDTSSHAPRTDRHDPAPGPSPRKANPRITHTAGPCFPPNPGKARSRMLRGNWRNPEDFPLTTPPICPISPAALPLAREPSSTPDEMHPEMGCRGHPHPCVPPSLSHCWQVPGGVTVGWPGSAPSQPWGPANAAAGRISPCRAHGLGEQNLPHTNTQEKSNSAQ